MKTFEIDFGGNVLAKIVIENDIPKVIACIDGYGSPITVGIINITELEA